jgi:hypothetical protein
MSVCRAGGWEASQGLFKAVWRTSRLAPGPRPEQDPHSGPPVHSVEGTGIQIPPLSERPVSLLPQGRLWIPMVVPPSPSPCRPSSPDQHGKEVRSQNNHDCLGLTTGPARRVPNDPPPGPDGQPLAGASRTGIRLARTDSTA